MHVDLPGPSSPERRRWGRRRHWGAPRTAAAPRPRTRFAAFGPASLKQIDKVCGVPGGEVPLGHHALEQARVTVRLEAHHEEGGRSLLGLQDVEDLGRVFGVGAVVKSEGDLLGVLAAPPLQHIG